MFLSQSLQHESGHKTQQEALNEQLAAPSQGVSLPAVKDGLVSSMSNDDNLKGKLRR